MSMKRKLERSAQAKKPATPEEIAAGMVEKIEALTAGVRDWTAMFERSRPDTQALMREKVTSAVQRLRDAVNDFLAKLEAG